MANEVKLTGYMANIKKISDKLVTFSMSVGSKQEDGTYKNGFVNCKSNKVSEVVADKRVDVEGWMTFDFWEDKETKKERQRPIVFIKEIVDAKPYEG